MADIIEFLASGTWQAAALICAALLLATAVAVIYVTAYFQGRSLSFWPPKIGARPRTDGPNMRPQISKDSVKITEPWSRAPVPWDFTVKGIARDIPDGHELWIFTTDGSGLSSRYWPQDRVLLREDGTWIGQVHGIGGKPNAARTFGVFLVGPDGQVLVDYWKAAEQQLLPGASRLALTRLTQDIQKCHEVDVVVESGRPGRPA